MEPGDVHDTSFRTATITREDQARQAQLRNRGLLKARVKGDHMGRDAATGEDCDCDAAYITKGATTPPIVSSEKLCIMICCPTGLIATERLVSIMKRPRSAPVSPPKTADDPHDRARLPTSRDAARSRRRSRCPAASPDLAFPTEAPSRAGRHSASVVRPVAQPRHVRRSRQPTHINHGVHRLRPRAAAASCPTRSASRNRASVIEARDSTHRPQVCAFRLRRCPVHRARMKRVGRRKTSTADTQQATA